MMTATQAATNASDVTMSVFQRSRMQSRLGYLVRVLLLLLTSVLMLAPIAFALVTSLRSPVESFTLPPKWIPADPDWSNYKSVFTTIPFERYIINSSVVTLAIVLGQLITSALA